MTEEIVRKAEEAPAGEPHTAGGEEEGLAAYAPDSEAGSAPSAEGGDGLDTAVSPEQAEEIAAEEALGEVEEHLGSELDEVQQELDGLHDRHLRLAAEFDNYRRRVQTEMSEAWIRAQSDLVRRLLDSVDDLQRVALLDPETATVQAIVEGVDLVERKVLKALEEAGVEVFDPVGEDFDPERMEAMMRVAAESEEDDDVVHEVFQRGYLLKGHLVRPARVSVRKHG